MLQALRDDLLPVIIVVSLIGLYGYTVVTSGQAPDDLRTLVATVTAFYFGGRVTGTTSATIRRTAAAIANGKSGTGGSDGQPVDGG